MTARGGAEQFHAEFVEQWRDWLEANHATSTGVWLVIWRRRTGRPTIGYDAAITQAVAFGWVDGQSKSIDDERTALWFVHRRPGSPWSRTNRERVARLEATGRMHAAGEREVQIAKETGTWTILEAAEALTVPDDLAAALGAAHATDAWDRLTPGIRRATLIKLALAKRNETRARYVTEAVAALDDGRGRAPRTA